MPKTDHKHLLQTLSTQAKNSNIYLVSRLQKSRYKSLEAVGDEINEVKSGRRSGLGLHLFDKEGHSILTSTDNLDDASYVPQLLGKATNELKNINKKATKTRAIFDLKKTTGRKNLAKTFDINKFTTTELEQKLLEHNKKVKKMGKDLGMEDNLNIRTHFNTQENSWHVTRTDGTDVFWSIPSCLLGTTLSYQGKKQKVEDYVTKSSPNWGVLGSAEMQKNFFAEIGRVLNLLKDSADKTQYPAGNYPLVIDFHLGGLLAHEAFGHAAESDGILSGNSILSKNKKLDKGKVVASNVVSILDETEKENWGYSPYSAFGQPRKKVKIVENGKLNAAISDTISGAKIGDTPRGCARAQDYDDVPVPRMSNTFISVDEPHEGLGALPSAEKLRDSLLETGLLKDKALFLSRSGGGGQVDTHSGTFMFIFNYLFELTPDSVKLYRGSSFSGQILDALKAIEAGLGNVKTWGSGWCGKRGQKVHVSMGSNQFLYLDKTPAVTLGGVAKEKS